MSPGATTVSTSFCRSRRQGGDRARLAAQSAVIHRVCGAPSNGRCSVSTSKHEGYPLSPFLSVPSSVLCRCSPLLYLKSHQRPQSLVARLTLSAVFACSPVSLRPSMLRAANGPFRRLSQAKNYDIPHRSSAMPHALSSLPATLPPLRAVSTLNAAERRAGNDEKRAQVARDFRSCVVARSRACWLFVSVSVCTSDNELTETAWCSLPALAPTATR